MTKKVFWDDPYCTRLNTHITSVNIDRITLAETIFFAFSGGQESDTGTIAGQTVLDARCDGNDIYYRLDRDHGLKTGDEVEIVIDWQRRHRLMRLHFAAEIILELVYRDYGPVEKTGAHIAEDKSRIDFS